MILYLYQLLGECPEKKVLKVKNPYNRKEKWEVEYLKKRDFKEFRHREEEAERVVSVIGFTKLKEYVEDEDDEAPKPNKLFVLHNAKYLLDDDKSFLRHIKGYVKVKPIYDEDGDRQALSDQDNNSYWIAVTRFTILPLLLLLLLLLCLLGKCSRKAPEKPTPITETTTEVTTETTTALPSETIITEVTTENQTTEPNTLPTDPNIVPWDNELPTSPSSELTQEEIELVGYDKQVVSENYRYINLINPKDNTVYFKYTVRVDGKNLFSSDLIPPNSYIPWNAYSTLTSSGYSSDDGEIKVEFLVMTFDIDTQAPCNPASILTSVTIE